MQQWGSTSTATKHASSVFVNIAVTNQAAYFVTQHNLYIHNFLCTSSYLLMAHLHSVGVSIVLLSGVRRRL